MSRSRRLLAEAITLDRQGSLSEAVTAYRKVLADEPRNGDALHSLGIALAKMGRVQDAVGFLAAAVQVQPRNFAWHTNLGSALSTLGQHAEAVACYEQALGLKPDLAAAHRGRGLALLRTGKFESAVSSLEQALRLVPGDASTHADLGVALERVGRQQEAVRCLRRATQLNPTHANAHHNLGLLEATRGEFAAALASLDRALALQPNRTTIHGDRGNVLLSLGRPAEAVESYDRALAQQPRDATLHHNLGMALMALERYADAVGSFEVAASLHAGVFNTHFYRGLALLQLERSEESLAAFDQALALDPDSAEVLNNRGVALARLSRPEEALECFEQALRCKPDNAQSHTNAGNILKGLRRYREAIESFDRGLAIKPDDAMTAWSKALLMLTLGEFREGWPLYEARFRLAHLAPLQRRFDILRWSGREPLEGKTLLVYAEQGFGDTLQFCRYVPLLEARGAKVVFEVQPSLKNLLRSLDMRGTLIACGEPLPQADLACPLLSLPLEFGTEIDDIPAAVPYLSAESAAVDLWKSRLDALPGHKIGLAWQGNPETEKQPWVRGRSFALREAAGLARLAGVSLISLQKGAGSEQRDQVEFQARIAQLTDPRDVGLGAFGETAALVKALDLVITSDTSVAHLAGALGAPVWVVLQFEPDWRWLTAREDNPWYPTMRLFRQRRPGDWSELFERVARALQIWAADRARTIDPGWRG